MDRNQARAAFTEKFRTGELDVWAGTHWRLSVRPVQATLGALVLSATRDAFSFGEIDGEAGDELLRALQCAEQAAASLFGAVRVNVLCFMMQDPIVHFHLIPRYADLVEYAGQTWTDEAWPGPPGKIAGTAAPAEVLNDLVKAYRDTMAQAG